MSRTYDNIMINITSHNMFVILLHGLHTFMSTCPVYQFTLYSVEYMGVGFHIPFVPMRAR